MAMLAEPRQRKRYNLVPRGKPLYEDKNRFGTKMLEKMGWESGKGLGVKEDGTKDFIRIRYKNDELGLGYVHRDDQWTQHEQSFNGLLKALNNEEETSETEKQQENGNESEDDMPTVGFGFPKTNANEEKKQKVEKLKEKISGVSLEERSKQSKARVHYKKFTKGKDLAQYSEKDLANIFGKKAVDEQQEAANDFYQQLNNTFEKKQEETKMDDDANESLESKDLINTGVSVNDYFKAKMEALKNRKNGCHNQENIADNSTDNNETQLEEVSKKKKKKKKEKKDQEFEEENINNDTQKEKDDNSQIIYSSVSVTDYFKMKMEALKNKKNGLNIVENIKDNSDDVKQEEATKKKKKKKNDKEQDNVKSLEQDDENNTNESETKSEKYEEHSHEEEPKTKKKKDKSKNKIPQETEQIASINENEIAKKRKHDNISTDNNQSANTIQNDIVEIDLTEEPRKKKKKKSKTKESEINEIIEIDESDKETPNTTEDQISSIEKKKTKKSKRNKESDESTEKEENSPNSNEIKIVSDLPASKKPKKNKKKEKNSAT